jgi:hypothetical protein
MKILQQAHCDHSPTRWKLAIVTGLSNPECCALSSQQHRLLDRMVQTVFGKTGMVPDGAIVRTNFPYASAEARTINKPHLVRASWANLTQYFRCRSKQHVTRCEPHWRSLFASTRELYLIAGSCGLELVLRGIHHAQLSGGNLPRISILALGPVASRSAWRWVHESHYDLVTVRGTLDWIASRSRRGEVVRVPRLGHLGYWDHQQVETIACEWLRSRISGL